MTDTTKRLDPFAAVDDDLTEAIAEFKPKPPKPAGEGRAVLEETEKLAEASGFDRRPVKKPVPRPKLKPVMKPIQFKISEADFAAFSEMAGKEFGFNKGSKSALFLKMFNAYRGKSA